MFGCWHWRRSSAAEILQKVWRYQNLITRGAFEKVSDLIKGKIVWAGHSFFLTKSWSWLLMKIHQAISKLHSISRRYTCMTIANISCTSHKNGACWSATISRYKGDKSEENPRRNNTLGKGAPSNTTVKIWSALFNAGKTSVDASNRPGPPLKLM